ARHRPPIQIFQEGQEGCFKPVITKAVVFAPRLEGSPQITPSRAVLESKRTTHRCIMRQPAEEVTDLVSVAAVPADVLTVLALTGGLGSGGSVGVMVDDLWIIPADGLPTLGSELTQDRTVCQRASNPTQGMRAACIESVSDVLDPQPVCCQLEHLLHHCDHLGDFHNLASLDDFVSDVLPTDHL